MRLVQGKAGYGSLKWKAFPSLFVQSVPEAGSPEVKTTTKDAPLCGSALEPCLVSPTNPGGSKNAC